jgi:uncharacterized membrane protein YfcA
MTFIELAAIGLVVGTFIGISGVGGGSIMTPILILVLGVNPLVAVGTDLLYSVPTKILGAVLHARQRTVDWHVVAKLLWGGIPGAILGLVLLYVVRHDLNVAAMSVFIKRAVAAALFVSAAALAFSIIERRKIGSDAQDSGDFRGRTPAIVASGAAVGFFVALTSIGSGAMTMPLLLLIVPFVGLRRLIGSDIVYAAFLIPLAALGQIALGNINYGIAFTLLAGSLPGVYLGSRLCKYLPEIWLRPAVATILVVAGWRLI